MKFFTYLFMTTKFGEYCMEWHVGKVFENLRSSETG